MMTIYLLMGLEILVVMLVSGYLIRKIYLIFLARREQKRNKKA